MLVRDAHDRALQRRRVVHVLCVGQYRTGQRALLLAALLVAHVEDVLQLGMRFEQALIEALDDGQAVDGQYGRGGLDVGDGFWLQHGALRFARS